MPFIKIMIIRYVFSKEKLVISNFYTGLLVQEGNPVVNQGRSKLKRIKKSKNTLNLKLF